MKHRLRVNASHKIVRKFTQLYRYFGIYFTVTPINSGSCFVCFEATPQKAAKVAKYLERKTTAVEKSCSSLVPSHASTSPQTKIDLV